MAESIIGEKFPIVQKFAVTVHEQKVAPFAVARHESSQISADAIGEPDPAVKIIFNNTAGRTGVTDVREATRFPYSGNPNPES